MTSQLSQDSLAQVASAAESHFESFSDALPGEMLDRWSRIVAGGDPETFAKRRSWGRVHAATPVRADGELPAWTQTLRAIVEAAQGRSNIGPLVDDDPLPFEEVWLPAISVARDRFAASSRSNTVLSEAAHIALERNLLSDLAYLAVASLQADFESTRPAGYRLTALLSGGIPDPPPNGLYTAFVESLLQDGLAGLFIRRPVLAHAVARLVDAWVESNVELVNRLKTDWSHELPVLRLAPGLSDRHHDGRSVTALWFAAGRAVVYKPRPCELEAVFQKFLSWCNETGELPRGFKTVAVFDRGEYGWVDLIEPAGCADAEAGARFYERMGMLLCILRVLRATDCHRDNIFAVGEHPVLVDAETLMHSEMRPGVVGVTVPASTSLDGRFRDSVLRTGMLPRWDFLHDDTAAIDVSAIGGSRALDAERAPRWIGTNTDFMYRGFAAPPPGRFPNVPKIGGRDLDPNDHVEPLVRGFEAAYEFLLRHRSELLSDDGPLKPFRDLRARFVFRPTYLYFRALERSMMPDIRDGLDRSIMIDVLSRTYLMADERPEAWPLAGAEAAAVERFDIPYFSASTTSRTLTGEGVQIPEFFQSASFDDALDQIRRLSPDDMRLQVSFIRGALHARAARSPSAAVTFEAPAHGSIEETVSPPSTDFLAAALSIGEEIADRALWTEDRSANWIGLSGVIGAERYQLEALDSSLYSGAPGVALFLASLHRLTARGDFDELARASLKPLQHAIELPNRELARGWARVVGIGGCTGLGSCVYALTRIADVLDDDRILADAFRVADFITPDAIASDRRFDIIGGSAGAILALLELARVGNDPKPLAIAVRCGDHLIANMVPTSTPHRAWRTVDPVPLTGFSHGSAGIAHALLRLFAATSDPRYENAAKEALAFERACYSPAHRNWPDFRRTAGGAEPRFMVSWCHGAAGIGLGRLGAMDVMDTSDIREDIDAAIDSVMMWGTHDVDHPCCGNAGRAEMLLLAGKRLGRAELIDEARRRMGWVVQHARSDGGFHLFPNVAESVFSPGFFQGLAGIGYTLLRLHDPELHSVLLLG